MIVDKVDVFTLKTMPIFNNKTALKYVQEKVDSGFDEFEELRHAIASKNELLKVKKVKGTKLNKEEAGIRQSSETTHDTATDKFA